MESLLEEMPECAVVIEGMNKEFDEAMERIKELEKERDYYKHNHPELKRFQVPKIKVDTVEEYNEYESRIEEFEQRINSILYNSDNIIEDLSIGLGIITRYAAGGSNNIVINLIDALNELTNNINPEWSRFRILHAIELSFGTDEYQFKDVVLQRIMGCGACSGINVQRYYSLDGITPSHNLSGWDDGLSPALRLGSPCNDEERTLNLYNLCYYTCQECGNEDDYGLCEKTNQLLCCDCQLKKR